MTMLLHIVTIGVLLVASTYDTNGQKYDWDGKTYEDPAYAHDADHISSHLKEDYGVEVSTENMTNAELEWHYFNLHDTDDNYMLDGLEMFKGWQHHYISHVEKEAKSEEEIAKLYQQMNDVFIGIVDEVLTTQDTDKDGYINYLEFSQARSAQDTDTSA